MFFLAAVFFILLGSSYSKVTLHHNRSQSKPTITDMLDELFKKPRYDPRLRPKFNGILRDLHQGCPIYLTTVVEVGLHYGIIYGDQGEQKISDFLYYEIGGAVVVTTGFWVLSIDTISVQDMAFGMDIFLRQNWVDERLNHGINETLSLSNTVIANIWLPDSYFKNAKQANFHEVTAKNLMITIGPKGLVHYNTRITLKASCPMDLRLYPFDIQQCPMIIESYGYSDKHIYYQWEKQISDGMAFVPSDVKMLPQFKLTSLVLSRENTQYVVGNWSGVMATFTFERTYSFYVIHIYGPSALIVVISWISFLLPRDQSPARVTLGVTSVLTEVTILTLSNNAMPKVNYVKAIDKYLIACFLFVFASLVEYSFILILANRTLRHAKRKRELRRKMFERENGSNDRDLSTQNGCLPITVTTDRDCACHKEMNGSSARERNRSSRKFSAHVSLPRRDRVWDRLRDIMYREETILAVDELSRRLFPLAFSLFNLYYWICVFYCPQFILSK